MHTHFQQTVTATEGYNTDPNLQNIPVRTEIGKESVKYLYRDWL
ncbi:MAG: hypothetical protein ACLR2G_05680 [Phascolarctobacterium faecium]